MPELLAVSDHFCLMPRVCRNNQQLYSLTGHYQSRDRQSGQWGAEIAHPLPCVSFPVTVALRNRIHRDVPSIALADLSAP